MEGEEGGNWVCKKKRNYNQDILYFKKVFSINRKEKKKLNCMDYIKEKKNPKTPRNETEHP